MQYTSLFKMPKPVKITGRSSSITNSFVNAIIPVIVPNSEQVKQALEILGMNHDSFSCAYCGDTASEWDHLRPLVVNQKPTGHISEIQNLVPACGKCNQSKGNKPWEVWIKSSAKLSPQSRGIANVEQRIVYLNSYERLMPKPTLIDFESIVGTEKWEQHWANWQSVLDTMKTAQVLADEIKETVARQAKNITNT